VAVIHALSSEARWSAAAAVSSGVPWRPSEIIEPWRPSGIIELKISAASLLRAAGGAHLDVVLERVEVGPGRSVSTRMRRSASPLAARRGRRDPPPSALRLERARRWRGRPANAPKPCG